MFKRRRPDVLGLATWAAEHLRFAPDATWRARALWLHWSDYAKEHRLEAGTPRAFSNALRKLGAPIARGTDVTRRTRLHCGVALVNWRTCFDDVGRPSTITARDWTGIRVEQWLSDEARYRDGYEYRGLGHKWGGRIAAAEAREAA